MQFSNHVKFIEHSAAASQSPLVAGAHPLSLCWARPWDTMFCDYRNPWFVSRENTNYIFFKVYITFHRLEKFSLFQKPSRGSGVKHLQFTSVKTRVHIPSTPANRAERPGLPNWLNQHVQPRDPASVVIQEDIQCELWAPHTGIPTNMQMCTHMQNKPTGKSF